MSVLKTLLQLIRWPNLVIVFFAQYFYFICLLQPFQPVFSWQTFYLVAFACVCVAASGNIINDYYDRDIDKINKPEKVIIGKSISPPSALLYYSLLNGLGMVLSFYADFYQGGWVTRLFVLATILLLWLYSRFFKKAYLIGNIIVALLSTAPLVLLTVIEIRDFGISYQFPIILLFIYFSFWTSLIREIVKDCEDIEGDKAAGAQTLPIVSGLSNAIALLSLLIVFIIAVLITVSYFLFLYRNILLLIYTIVIILLFCILLNRIRKAGSSIDFHQASTFAKWIMIGGTISMIFVRYTL